MADLRQTFDDLVRFETILWNVIDTRLQDECELSLGSLNAMLVIASTPSCRVQDLARALEVTVGGISQAVDRLEAAGHAQRRPNPSDRRSSVIELTPSGAKQLARAEIVFDRELERFFAAPLSERALGQLSSALAVVRGAAAQAGAPDPGRR